MSEPDELLKRQADWQKERRKLSWPEKMRMAEAVRESVVKLRRTYVTPQTMKTRFNQDDAANAG